jgi:hypothetical protein
MTAPVSPAHYFDPADFGRFAECHPAYGDPENKPIYFLFDMDREHEDLETTKAKFKYIDRIYNANIGNFVGKARVDTGGQLGVYWLAEQLHADAGFRTLVSDASISDGLNEATIDRAISTVQRFVGLINGKVKRTTDGAVSACSKYLHFHSRAHPLYDSNASTALHVIFTAQDWRSLLSDPAREKERNRHDGCLTYPQLCANELQLLKIAFPDKRAFQREVKQLDHYLIALYRREWTAR